MLTRADTNEHVLANNTRASKKKKPFSHNIPFNLTEYRKRVFPEVGSEQIDFVKMRSHN